MFGSITGVDDYDPIITSSGCVSGNCLQFESTADWLYVTQDASLNPVDDQLTIELFFKPLGLGGYSDSCHGLDLIENAHSDGGCNYNEWGIGFTNTQHFFALSGNGLGYDTVKTTSTNTINIGEWAHGVWVYNSGSSKIYLNGLLEGSNSGFSGSLQNVAHLVIGNCEITAASKKPFDGLIDEVRIYNGALSSSQIKQSYLSGLSNLLSQGLISEEEYEDRLSEI